MAEWKGVVGYEVFYEVSDEGQVRSLARKVGARFGKRVRAPSLITSRRDKWRPYRRVVLTDAGGKKRTHKVHHLVLRAFVGPRPVGMKGLHRDDDRENNTLPNLYWGTSADNNRDCVRNGHQRPGISLGSKHGHAKLTESDIPKIFELHRRRLPLSRIAEYFGVTDMTIHDVVKGVTWRHVTGGP